MQSHFRNFLEDESAATAVEYTILISMIAIVLIPAANFLGSKLSAHFKFITDALDKASNPNAGFMPFKSP